MKKFYWKNDKLRSDSIIYRRKAGIYESFSQAEDFPDKIFQFLKSVMKRKIILDLGCGTGKFIPKIAPLSKKYLALDISEHQINIAIKKTKDLKNVEFIHAPAANTRLKTSSIDVVFASWLLGSVHDLNIRKRIVREAYRVLKKDGVFYVIENDVGGEFKNIIESIYGDKKTRLKLKWLEKLGFRRVASIETSFEFESLKSARNIFSSIWGNKISGRIKRKKVSHHVAIYKLEK